MTKFLKEFCQCINNTSDIRCALESNNASNTVIKNCIIANNASTNANAIGFIATNRDATVQIQNLTILGETKDNYIITFQVGVYDQLDVIVSNSIIAHHNSRFSKSIKLYNYGSFNLSFEHNNSYFQGSSVFGNGTNALFSVIDGDLLLNSDYSVIECSPCYK